MIVTLFCTLRESENACNSRMSVCFLTRTTCKNVRQNLIPRATAYASGCTCDYYGKRLLRLAREAPSHSEMEVCRSTGKALTMALTPSHVSGSLAAAAQAVGGGRGLISVGSKIMNATNNNSSLFTYEITLAMSGMRSNEMYL